MEENTANKGSGVPGRTVVFIRQDLRNFPVCQNNLYYIGSFPDDAKPTAAIVGARLCSPYGRIQAFNYGKFLSEHGVQVISGMAAGIDAEGHKGALEGGTPTFAVLGNGVDICYPHPARYLPEDPRKNGGNYQRI